MSTFLLSRNISAGILFALLTVFFLNNVQAQDVTIGMNQTQDITTNTTWSSLIIKNGGSLTLRSGDTLTVGNPGNP